MAELQNKDTTPAMRQYQRFKQQYPQCVLFFRMGDFYELFYDDAKLASRVLGVALTQRTKGVPMAGVPYHAVEGYLRRMIEAGYRVAVCDQVEDAAQAKGIVKRDVTRVITPGTLTDEALLEEGQENPLAAVVLNGDVAAVAWADLSTGSFQLGIFRGNELKDELARIRPRELLYPESDDVQIPAPIDDIVKTLGCVPACRPGWQFRYAEAIEVLHRQFQVVSLGGFGLEESDEALGPAGAIVHYLLETQKTSRGTSRDRIAHLQPPRRFTRSSHLIIDQVSLRSLEVEQTIRSGSMEGSLLGVLSDCRTAMGKRTLRRWLCYPLASREPIEQRQRAVSALADNGQFLNQLRQRLDDVQDVQRIIGRIAVQRATPRDLVALGSSAKQVRALTELLESRPSVATYRDRLADITATLAGLAEHIGTACIDTPPPHLRDGGLFRNGYDKALDEYRALKRDSHSWLARYQKQLIEQTDIQTLKVGFNKVFGYYIEVTAANRERAPDSWSRKQTLKNAERYITPELKTFEGKVLSAERRSIACEQALFAQLCERAEQHMGELQVFADVVAELDVLACFARRAIRSGYVKPAIVEQSVLHIKGGRHPVLDQVLADQFVPNDVELGKGEADRESPTLALITGPNMAGKSTYIRQTALITLLAHTGSFVPADEATIGLCDRIFTRVGASDELHAGQSTFMVEMTETANICHDATLRSLVILDEIGRGTSTLDGLALAWALGEHLAQRCCRTLFATHYHEITVLSQHFPNVVNLNVTIREWKDQIVFLHRIIPGATDRSYGIHVAKIAGLPKTVIDRANELLDQLEVSHGRASVPELHPNEQLSLFKEYINHPAMQELRDIDLDSLTPIQAFERLRQLQQHLGDSGGQ